MFKVIADIVDWLPKNAVQRIDKKITFSNYLKSKIGAHDRSKVINKLQTEAETIEKYFHFVVAPTQWNHQISRVCLYSVHEHHRLHLRFYGTSLSKKKHLMLLRREGDSMATRVSVSSSIARFMRSVDEMVIS